jgi:hypothetical protein
LVVWALVRWYQRTPPADGVPAGVGVQWQVGFAGAVVAAGLVAWWSARGLVTEASDLYGLRVLMFEGLTRSITFVGAMVLIGCLVVRVHWVKLGSGRGGRVAACDESG